MFHVEQPLGLSTLIRGFRRHLDAGMPGEEPAPEVAGKAGGNFRTPCRPHMVLAAMTAFGTPGSPRSTKHDWQIVTTQKNANSPVFCFFFPLIPELFLCLFLVWSRLCAIRFLVRGEHAARPHQPPNRLSDNPKNTLLSLSPLPALVIAIWRVKRIPPPDG